MADAFLFSLNFLVILFITWFRPWCGQLAPMAGTEWQWNRFVGS